MESSPSPLPHILPSNQSTVAAASSRSSLPSPVAAGPLQALEPGPGPLRHPRPMTAAELHTQMEKEQEAMVNRLSRELSMVRAANNASAASNASSNASGADAIAPPSIVDSHLFSGPVYRTPSRRHNRSLSNASSSRSTTAAVAGSAVSTPAPPGVRPSPHVPVSMSRQSSATSMRQSSYSHHHYSIPGSAPQGYADPSLSSYFQRDRLAQATTTTTGCGPGSAAASASVVSTPAGMPSDLSRLEETAFYRAELDAARRENEALKAKIRQLEKMVRHRRTSDASVTSAAPAPGSSSTQATAAGHASLPHLLREQHSKHLSAPSLSGSVGVGVPEEEVKVGESAASAGLGTTAPAS